MKVVNYFLVPSVIYSLWIAFYIHDYFIPFPQSWLDMELWWHFPLFFTNLVIVVLGIALSNEAIKSLSETENED